LINELNASVQRSIVNDMKTTTSPNNKRDNPLVGSFGLSPVEEGSKLNMLIEEYRRENDRCSQRILDLQRKLNSTQSK